MAKHSQNDGNTPSSLNYWTPTEQDQTRAREVASRFAVDRLKVPAAKVAQLETAYRGVRRNGRPLLTITFFNPQTHPRTSTGSPIPMLGGFPEYFEITLDARTWRVTDHYASPE